MENRLARAAMDTSNFQNGSQFTKSRRRYMAEIFPIRRKTPSNQSIESVNIYAMQHKTHVSRKSM